MSKTISDFINHGHKLANADWSAWYCAYQYAKEFYPVGLHIIDKGCNYAENQRPIPERCLKLAEKLYKEALAKKT